MEIRPVDLPILRDETRRDVADYYPSVYEAAIERGVQYWRPELPPKQAAAYMVAAECRRLDKADLFYVSADMTELAKIATASMPGFHFMPEDLPARHGFMFFDSPIDVVTSTTWGDTERTPIVAVCWGVWDDCPPAWIHGGVWITWYSDRDGMLASGDGTFDRKTDEWYRHYRSRLLLDNESPKPFSPDDLPVLNSTSGEIQTYADAVADGQSLIEWVGILKTTWLLMGQTLASDEVAKYDRAARRRIEKRGQEPPPVRVISLRRHASTSGDGDSGREYQHQWMVRGHWRQQYYPSRGVHRPVWIAPHIKGPEGAPLIGGEKVYALTR